MRIMILNGKNEYQELSKHQSSNLFPLWFYLCEGTNLRKFVYDETRYKLKSMIVVQGCILQQIILISLN